MRMRMRVCMRVRHLGVQEPLLRRRKDWRGRMVAIRKRTPVHLCVGGGGGGGRRHQVILGVEVSRGDAGRRVWKVLEIGFCGVVLWDVLLVRVIGRVWARCHGRM
jgi:hypothetical protein